MLDEDNKAFWQSGQEGVLRITRCKDCGWFIHPHTPICPRCRSRDLAPQAVSGRATVETFTINRHLWEAGLTTPYVIAIVSLIEQAGLNLMTNIIGCEPDSVRIGMDVQVVFERVEDIWLPLFAPAALTAVDGD